MQSDLLNSGPPPQEMKLVPTCPKCGAGRGPGENGAPLSMLPIQMGPASGMVIFCGNEKCGQIYNVQVMEVLMPGGDRHESGLIIPS